MEPGFLQVTGGTTELVRGQTRPQVVPVQPPATERTAAGAEVAHDAPGLLSGRGRAVLQIFGVRYEKQSPSQEHAFFCSVFF